ncbi:MAG: EI24 domain-containing protein [Myxococcales bacterium]|nr:MAG: EI24 domain-containing protein [Myxococcales bacterium]
MLGFFAGFKAVFRGADWVYRKRLRLARIWVFPIAITFVCFAAVFVSSVFFSDDLLALFWSDAGSSSWWKNIVHTLLRWVIGIALAVGGVVLVYFTSTIVAAPFNDVLSERIEKEASGANIEPLSWMELGHDILRTVSMELVRFLVYLLIMVPLFVLSLLVPGVGQVAYAAVGFLFTAFYFALDYMDWPMARAKMTMSERFSLIFRYPGTALGFGTGVWLLLFIPIVNLFFMPAAVAGGTLLFLEIREYSRKQQRSPERQN